METIKYETRKARKEHSCDYCRRKIKPGENYHYSFNIDGGDNWSLKECVYCNYIIPFITNHNDLMDGIYTYEMEDFIFDKGEELKLIKPNEKRTFELLQRLSHNIAFHYGFGKKDRLQ